MECIFNIKDKCDRAVEIKGRETTSHWACTTCLLFEILKEIKKK